MSKISKQSHAGFTLIETLFAILIFTASIVSLMMLSGRSLASTKGSSDELAARYLAQEGIEVARNVRDSNFVSDQTDWLTGIRDCTQSAPCSVDVAGVIPALVSCGGTCAPLTRDTTTGEYGNNALPDQTTFVRSVYADTTLGNQALVTVKVEWQQRTRSRTVELQTIITEWR